LKRTDIEEESLKEILIEFLYRIFFKILNSNARERKVVIVESILTDSFFRKVLAEVLFKSFQVVSVLFLPSHLASLYTLGLNTGLVIDCGFVDCQLLPITESVLMSGLCNFVNIGAKKIHQELEKLIREYAFITIKNQKTKLSDLNPQLIFTEETIEDIKLRCCFVTNLERSRKIQEEIKSVGSTSLADLKFSFAPDCDYNLDDKTLHLPGFVRETVFEVYL
jgi:actin-related protein 10